MAAAIDVSTSEGIDDLSGTVVIYAVVQIPVHTPGQVTDVRFYVSDVLLETVTSPPYQASWDTLLVDDNNTAVYENGDYQLRVSARYGRHSVVEEKLDVNVLNVPEIWIPAVPEAHDIPVLEEEA